MVKLLVGASSVVGPCIAEWGWSRQRVIGLVRRRAGLPLMSVEITVVSQCRVGLAPTVSFGRTTAGQAARVADTGPLLPWVAMLGSQAWPVVMTACRWRKIAAAMTLCAWVGLSLLFCLVVRCRYLAA